MNQVHALLCLLVATSVSAFDVVYSPQPPTIDGLNTEAQWHAATWRDLDHIIIGGPMSETDFSGQFRLLWDAQKLYLQVRMQDDVLIDRYANPLTQYWDDDCLEVFIDEDASGGEHQYNHNAFAYHIGLDNQVADLAPNKQPALYNEHIESRWKRSAEAPYRIVWEAAISIYNDQYQDGKSNQPIALHESKQLGFMLAYCDNDGSEQREHFIGSKNIEAVEGDKNRGWIDASVFDKIRLKK